jgi:hypothetical protein
MHTRSAKNKVTGKFTVTVWDWNGAECFRGDFDDMHEADRAAEREERAMTLRMQMPADAATPLDDILMTDDELLAALSE